MGRTRLRVLLTVGLAVGLLATQITAAEAVVSPGVWNNLPDSRPNWHCGETGTKEIDVNGAIVPGGKVHWYSQHCVIQSGRYVQSALILRRGSEYPDRNFGITGWSRLTWPGNKSNVQQTNCAHTVFTVNEVAVCYSKTARIAARVHTEAWGGADYTNDNNKYVVALPPLKVWTTV